MFLKNILFISSGILLTIGSSLLGVDNYAVEQPKLESPAPLDLATVLGMNFDEFSHNICAQKILFISAVDFGYLMHGFLTGVVNDLNGATFKVSFKAYEAQQLARLIVKKCQRKKEEQRGYEDIGKMHDIVRARIDLKNQEGIQKEFQRVLRVLEKHCVKKGFKIVEIKEPVKTCTITICPLNGPEPEQSFDGYDYPRFHVKLINENEPVGFLFELQIGPRQVTDYFETKTEKLILKNWNHPIEPNLHDVAYKIFRPIFTYLEKKEDKCSLEVYLHNSLGDFFRKFGASIVRVGCKEISKESFNINLHFLHDYARDLLKAILTYKDSDFVLRHYR